MRQCPVCDYYLEPHDEECPRCKRNAETAAKSLDSVQTPSNSAPLPSAFACYYHQHVPAIGQCSECLRNCCKSCLKNVNGLLLCPEDAKTAEKRQEAAVKLAGRLFWYVIGAVVFIPIGLIFVHDIVLSAKIQSRALPVYVVIFVLIQPLIVARGAMVVREIRRKISPHHPIQGKMTFFNVALIISVVLYFVVAGFVYMSTLMSD